MKKSLAVLISFFILVTSASAETPEISGNLEVNDILDQAALARSAGNTGEAIQLYERAIQLDPENYVLRRNVGVLYYETKDYLAAAKALLTANKLKPDDPFTLVYTGKVMLAIDDFETAQPYLESAQKLDPNNPEVHAALGDLHRKLKEYNEAETAYEKAVELAPQSSAGYIGLGHLYYENRRYGLASKNFEEAVKINSENGDTWYNLGMSYLAQDNLNKAAECMHRSLTYQPNNPETFNALGTVFARAHLWDLAEKSYRKAVELKSDYSEARNNLANLQWNRREAEYRSVSPYDSPYESSSQRLGPLTVTTVSRRRSGFSDPFFDSPNQSMFSSRRRSYDPFDRFHSRRAGYDPITGYDPSTGYADTTSHSSTDALVALGAAMIQQFFSRKSDD